MLDSGFVAERWYRFLQDNAITVWYSAPTAIRSLMREGDEPVKATSRKSLRLLGSVGEPINPEAWDWYYNVVGDGRCPIVDTWWQTETGGILISPLPGATDLKPGSATKPLPGVKPALYDEKGNLLTETAVSGLLVLGAARRFYMGILPCFLAGRSSRLVHSASRASIRRGRVSLGTMTASI